MARIRTIKPEFFTSLTIADLTPEQRLTFIGLWTHADDAGRCVDDPRLIKAAVWPLDDRTAADVEGDLRALTESSLIARYIVNRKRFLAVTGWDEHQRINRPTPSKLPAPEQGEQPDPEPRTCGNDDSRTPHGGRTEDSPPERKGKEQGTGNRETPLPPASSQPPAPATAEDERPLPDRMTDAWWEKYSRGNAYSRSQVRRVIADTLRNGTQPDELWQALQRLGDTSKPVTPGTLQFAFAELRKPPSNVIALPTGQQLTGTDATVAAWLALPTGDRT